MELVVRKTDLLRELQLFQGIVERKNTIPILANVLIETDGDHVKFLATDLEVGLRTPPTGEVVVAFGHPLCTDCHSFEAEMRAAGRQLVVVDVRQHRWLARKYGVALVPSAVAVAPDGRVTARLAG